MDTFNGNLSAVLMKSGRDVVKVVGEASYQATLERIGGGRTPDGPRAIDHTAILLPEPWNAYDSNAVRVALVPSPGSAPMGYVGYLSRDDAVSYRPVIDRLAAVGKVFACRAELTGGWDRGADDRGHFGVVLYARTPSLCMRQLDEDADSLRPPWTIEDR